MADLKVALEDLAADSAAAQLAAQRPAVRTPRRWRWIWASSVPVVADRRLRRLAGVAAAGARDAVRAVPLTVAARRRRDLLRSRPTATMIAFGWTGPDGDNQDIYVQQIGAGAPIAADDRPGPRLQPVWSPDGRWIAFLRAGRRTPVTNCGSFHHSAGGNARLTEIRPRGFLRP